MGKRSREKQEKRMQQGDTDRPDFTSKYRGSKEKIYLSIIEWGTYLILLTPLIINRDFFFPYVVPKTIFFRILVDIIFIAYLLLIAAFPRYRPKLNALSWSIITFFTVSAIASVFGVNFIKSFWSTFERMTGLLTFAHLFAFFLVLTSVFKERKYWERILTVSILMGIILVFYVSTSIDQTARGGGTLGNTSFMSAYLLFNIFFAIILFFSKRGWPKLFYGFSLIPMVWLLFFSKEPTQGAMGAFWGGLFIFAFGYAIFYLFFSGKRNLKVVGVGLILFLILFGTIFSQTVFFKSKIKDISESTSWWARQAVWNISFQAWKERPWLGWGEENFNMPFAKYYDPSLPLSADMWYDRAHNIVFDVLVSSGIIGFLSYLSIFVVAAVGLLKLFRNLKKRNDLFIILGMISLLAVYFTQNIWVFDMISSYMMFFLSLAFVYFLIEEGKGEMVAEGDFGGKIPYIFISSILIIVALLAIYFGNVKPAQASYRLVGSLHLPLEEMIPSFQKSINTSPVGRIEGSEQFSRKMSEFAFSSDVDKNLLKEGLNLAESEMKENIERSPKDFRLYLVLGKQYNNTYYAFEDAEALISAKEILEKAKELSPKNQQAYWELAQNSLYGGQGEEAITYMQKSIDLEPKFGTSYWYAALVCRVLGKYNLSWEYMQDAKEFGYNWGNSVDDLGKVINVNQELANNQELISLYTAAIALEPKNAQFKAAMAVAYANLGQFDKAREMALEALKLNPDFIDELKDFIAGLPQ